MKKDQMTFERALSYRQYSADSEYMALARMSAPRHPLKRWRSAAMMSYDLDQEVPRTDLRTDERPIRLLIAQERFGIACGSLAVR